MSSPQENACYPEVQSLHYPPLGKAARVDGTVTVAGHIDPAGRVVADAVQGHPLLVAQAKADLAVLTLPAFCADRDLRLKIIYKLLGPNAGYEADKVANTAPGVYEITATPLIISDPPFSTTRRSWWRRLLARLF